MAPHEIDMLEGLIDRYNLDSVLGALSEICYAKAEHVRTTWQDAYGARKWVQAANQLVVTSMSVKVKEVSHGRKGEN